MSEHLENVEGQFGRKRKVAERLEEYPELDKRFEMILDIVDNAAGDVEKANEAERRVIEAVRQLGNEVMQGWAVRQLQKKEEEWGKKPGMNRKAKKTLLVHRLRKNRNSGAAIPPRPGRASGASVHRISGSPVPRFFVLFATGDGGFWGG